MKDGRTHLEASEAWPHRKNPTAIRNAGSLHSAHQRVKRSSKRSTRGLRFDCDVVSAEAQ
jgi:hypothetical protein